VHGHVQHVALASYFETGIGRGMGFRDSNQDLLGFVHLFPERARERIIDIASTQFPDGSAYHQYQPLTKRGNNDVGSGFNDDPLWLIFGVAAYIKETGDFAILDEQVPFDNDEEQRAAVRAPQALVRVHAQQPGPARAAADRPRRLERLPEPQLLLRDARRVVPDHREQGVAAHAESVFIAGMFVGVAPDYAYLADASARPTRRRGPARPSKMREVVLEHGWDGAGSCAPTTSSARRSAPTTSPRADLDRAAGLLRDGRASASGRPARRRRRSTPSRSARHPYGIVLNNPPTPTYHVELGEISHLPAGLQGERGIFCHNNPWIIIAETVLGRGDRAFEYYKKITPAYLEDISEIHRLEPYVYAQMIAGKDAVRHGEAKNSWLTGTAAWNFVAVSQYLLGVRPGLRRARRRPASRQARPLSTGP
jgi:cellobiose phosphorylase